MPSQISNDLLLVARNLSFDYARQPILKNVSFEIRKGTFTGIIGPNGGGKTTLLKLLMGFLQPKSGTILLTDPKPKIAYVPQSLRLDRDFPITSLEVVLMGLLSELPWHGQFSESHKKRAADAIARMGLAPFAHARFGSLSGGQAQRILIARALVSNPDLLLLDEPTASVDPHAEQEIFRTLSELRDQLTLLMVTHDLNQALLNVDDFLCVRGGELFLLEPSQVCEHFALGLYHPPLQNMRDPS